MVSSVCLSAEGERGGWFVSVVAVRKNDVMAGAVRIWSIGKRG